MIRIVRTFEAQPGKRQQVIDVLKEISGYAETQNVNILVLNEPWGHLRRVQVHTDFDEADTALNWVEDLQSVPRAREAIQRLDDLTSGHVEAAFLTDQR